MAGSDSSSPALCPVYTEPLLTELRLSEVGLHSRTSWRSLCRYCKSQSVLRPADISQSHYHNVLLTEIAFHHGLPQCLIELELLFAVVKAQALGILYRVQSQGLNTIAVEWLLLSMGWHSPNCLVCECKQVTQACVCCRRKCCCYSSPESLFSYCL